MESEPHEGGRTLLSKRLHARGADLYAPFQTPQFQQGTPAERRVMAKDAKGSFSLRIDRQRGARQEKPGALQQKRSANPSNSHSPPQHH